MCTSTCTWSGRTWAGKLSPDREARLDALVGWTWDPKAELWEEGHRRLVKYAEQHGTVRVERSHVEEDGYRLGEWVKTQRDSRRKGSLATEREEALAALPDWSWDPKDDAWEEKFRELLAYVEEQGNASVKRDGSSLGGWVKSQRDSYRNGKLREDRFERLDRLPGWVWDRRGPGGQKVT